MTFLTGPRVLVRQVDAHDWRLEEEVVYAGRDEEFTVPVGTLTDFASVPRVFAWLVPSYGLFTAAAVLHDHLTRVEVPAGRIDPIDADGLFRRAMRGLGVPFLLRWFMWGAVRLGALRSADLRPGWLRELPRVVLVTLLALPVVALPAVTITVGMGVFAVLEFAVYGVLRAGGAREVVRPRPGMWT